MRRRRRVGLGARLIATVALAGLGCLGWYWWRGSGSVQHRSESSALPESGPVTNAPASGTGTKQLPLATPPGPRFDSSQTAPSVTRTNVLSTNGVVAPDLNVHTPESGFPRAVQNVFEMQVALARQCLSCGSIDGLIGPQSRAALESFQRREHLPVTGELDNTTREHLVLTEAPTTRYQVTSTDLARLQPLSSTWLGKSRQTALEYETLLELVSEKAQAHPLLVRRLNPGLDWGGASPGIMLELPNVNYPPPARGAAFITIQLGAKVLEAWDLSTNLLAHFPCSIARRVEKRPLGELHVAVIAHNPNYTFDPENFPESEEARQSGAKLILPPGPNNPVGTAWIGLDKPGYGIHGSPRPEQVGRTESHGCFRLANWNAEYLERLVVIGTPVYVQP